MCAYTAEPIPSVVIKTMLDSNWVENVPQVPKPQLIDPNDGTTAGAVRVNLGAGDAIVIRLIIPGETETYRDAWYYVDRINKVKLELGTKVSRQRLYDLHREARRIIHANKHSLTDYQVIRYSEFTELNQEELGVWRGEMILTLENNRISMEV